MITSSTWALQSICRRSTGDLCALVVPLKVIDAESRAPWLRIRPQSIKKVCRSHEEKTAESWHPSILDIIQISSMQSHAHAHVKHLRRRTRCVKMAHKDQNEVTCRLWPTIARLTSLCAQAWEKIQISQSLARAYCLIIGSAPSGPEKTGSLVYNGVPPCGHICRQAWLPETHSRSPIHSIIDIDCVWHCKHVDLPRSSSVPKAAGTGGFPEHH